MSDKSGGGRRTRAALAAGGRRATRSSLDARNALPARAIGRRDAERSPATARGGRGGRKRPAAETEANDEGKEDETPKKQKPGKKKEEEDVGNRRRRAKEDEETKGGEDDDGDDETKGREDQLDQDEIKEVEDDEKEKDEDEANKHTDEAEAKNAPNDREEEEEKQTTARSTTRVHVEEEEETKGGEEAQENEGEEQTGGRPRARVDVVADADFVRALVAAREHMEAAPRKMVVYDEIAENRFRNGRVAKARLEWLQIVRRDHSHAEHGRLTDEMKTLLTELETAAKAAKSTTSSASAKIAASPNSPKSPKSPKKRKRIGFVDPVRQRRLRRESLLASTTPTSADRPAAVSEKTTKIREVTAKTNSVVAEEKTFGSPLMKLHRSAAFDSAAEVNLMELVLDYASKFDKTDKRLGMWDDIAAATRGKYTSGISVKNHVWWVVRSLRDPEHRVSKEATTELRQLMDTFVTLHSNLSSEQEGPSKSVDASQKAPAPANKDSPVPGAAKETVLPANRPIIDVASDKLLVLLVSEKISSENSAQTSEKRWDEIAQAIQRQNPTIKNGNGAKARLVWLLSVFDDATHVEHEKLTPSLRKMLDEYKSKKGARLTEDVRPPPTVSAEGNAREASEIVLEDAEEEEDTENDEDGDENQDDRPKDTKRTPRNAQVNVQTDEELMRLVLQWRPSHLDRNSKGVVWAKIVDALQDPKITNGLAAHSRVRWLMNIYNQPNHAERSYLSDNLVTVLKKYSLLDDAAKADDIARVLNLNVDVSGDDDDEHDARADPIHGLLLRELLRLRPFHAKLGSGMGVWKQVASGVNRAAGVKVYPTGQSCLSQMKRLLAVVRNTTKTDIFLTQKQRVMTRLVDALLKIRWPKSKTELNDDHKACLAKIQRLLDGQPDLPVSHTTPRPRPRHHMPQTSPILRQSPANGQFTYEFSSPTTGVDSVDALQADIAQFRETTARDRASREEVLAKLKQQVAGCRTQLSDQMDKNGDERREQRDELRSVMDLLKNEREMHARENAMVLQVVQKERDDRRQEFGTLINLVTRAVHSRAHVEPSA